MEYHYKRGVLKSHLQKYRKQVLGVVSAAFLAVVLVSSVSVNAATATLYNAIPTVLPSSLPSLGYQATGTNEFGDLIEFEGATRTLGSATVTMVSWACETGGWNTNDCMTTPGSTFSHDITLNLYNVTEAGLPGSLIASVTDSFEIPYRPSSSTECDGGRWLDSAGACNNGFASNITFNLDGVTVPDQIIYGISYNTNTYGPEPIGAPGPYESLNVGLSDNTLQPTVGEDVDPDALFWNSETYGDGTFKLDTGWAPYTIAIRFDSMSYVQSKEECKNDGWKSGLIDRKKFKNQGDCVSYFASKMKNQPANTTTTTSRR